ncbi:MAG: hypothetical protein ACE5LU_19065 [Anaerolineae bacterium]
MTSFEDNTHVFIVRIWREPREIDGAAPEWRGVIEHVTTGERRYLKDVDAIVAFILPYLEGMGVELGLRWRVRRWLNQWKPHKGDQR